MGTITPINSRAISSRSPEHRKTWTNKTLLQLAEELDLYYASPETYDVRRIESIAAELFSELKKILVEGGHFHKFKESLRSPLPSFLSFLKKTMILLRSEEVDDFGLDRKFELSIKPIFDFLYYDYFRVRTKGIENVPSEGRCLLVSNHSGVLPYDAAMIKLSIFNEHPSQREVRFLVDDFVFHFPFLGVLMNRIGGVRACPENATRLLESDEIVSVFPEGLKGIGKKFSDRYRLQRFGRGGVIKLALKTKAPIVPIAVVGAEEIHPLLYKSTTLAKPLGLPFIPITPTFPLLGPLGAIPLPTAWTIRFGKPIAFDWATPKELNDGILINRETEKLRGTIQEMIRQSLGERKSIFLG
jgi:1-acyl-sn-glycerol-3-phosphate acyltransferase